MSTSNLINRALWDLDIGIYFVEILIFMRSKDANKLNQIAHKTAHQKSAKKQNNNNSKSKKEKRIDENMIQNIIQDRE